MIIKKGMTLTFTHGEYSGKDWIGPFNVLKDMDQSTVVKEFLAQFKPEYKGNDPDTSAFTGFLIKAGYITDIENAWEWHLGDYGFEPEIDGEPEDRP